MPSAGKTIVIVEDDAGLHQAFKRVLTAAGHYPLIFGSAEALIAEGDIPEAQCYVLDVRLPGKSGIELQRKLCADGSKVPVILITAHDEPAVHDAVARCGAAALLIKPFAGRKLLETIETVLESSPTRG